MKHNLRATRYKSIVYCFGIILGMMAVVIGVQARTDHEGATETRLDTAGTTLYIPMAARGREMPWSRDSIFGVQMYNETRPNSQYYQVLMESGATWVRIAINWNLMEPTNTSPDEYDWVISDKAFSAGSPTGGGLRMIGTIETGPTWALLDPNKPDGPINSVHLPDFKQYITAMVERYDGDGHQDAPGSPIVEYWEFYNEPDRRLGTGDGRWGDHGAEYAQMLAEIYPAVKAANPNAQVMLGGLAYDFFEDQGGPFVRSFLDDVLAAGGGNYFDVFNFHGYPSFAYNWLPAGQTDGGTGLLQKANYLREKLEAAGLNKPFFVTEAGWHSNNPPHAPGSEEIQSRYLVQLLTQSMAAEIDVMIWWMLYDPGSGGWDNGLTTLENPPRRKQSFLAHQTIVNQLTGMEFVRAFSPAETNSTAVEAYEFSDPLQSKTMYVAWMNPVDTSNTSTLSVSAEEVRTTSIYGVSGTPIADIADGTNDGHVNVTLTGQPVYIEVIR